MQTSTTATIYQVFDFSHGQIAPENINDYLGRLVVSSGKTHTVVRVEPSTRVVRRMDESVIPGAARLYIALPEADDGRPAGHWIEADTIAAPGLTVLHWDHRTDRRVDQATCKALYQSATAAEQQRSEERHSAHEARRAEEARCAIWWQQNTPEWAKSYLIAERRQDECDTMTDYFAYSVRQTVLLGFSKSDRNNFAEMRKFAATFPETAHLATSEGVEHRENYRGGSGYYLGGASSYSGWTIRKCSLKRGLPRGGNAVMDVSHWSARSLDKILAENCRSSYS